MPDGVEHGFRNMLAYFQVLFSEKHLNPAPALLLDQSDALFSNPAILMRIADEDSIGHPPGFSHSHLHLSVTQRLLSATIALMQLSDIFLRLGQDGFEPLLRSISLGRLKTFQLFDPLKTRLHLRKLNSETLRNSAPRLWARLQEPESTALATELGQAILISHMDMIKAVLDFLGVPHEDGFFAKDSDISAHLKDGWQQKAWDQFHATYAPAPLLFYINHLAWEVSKAEDIFTPGAAAPVGAEGKTPAKQSDKKSDAPQMSFDLG